MRGSKWQGPICEPFTKPRPSDSVTCCFLQEWQRLKCYGEDISSVLCASFSELRSQTNHSELIDLSLLFIVFPLTECFDCKAQIDSDSSNFLPAWWFSPIMLESSLQMILSHLLDTLKLHHLEKMSGSILNALRWFILGGSRLQIWSLSWGTGFNLEGKFFFKIHRLGLIHTVIKQINI